VTSHSRKIISRLAFDSSGYQKSEKTYNNETNQRVITSRDVERPYETKKVFCKISSQCNVKFDIEVDELKFQRRISKINKSNK